ncbi:hypothetical protein [Bifidobacterium catenulatum]|uniref:hypothetical protein n=1 Tax=Bifidobacterium catenulatum TaxID=1686 RepID=UPI003F914EE2
MNITVCNDGDEVPDGIPQSFMGKIQNCISTRKGQDGNDHPCFDFVGLVLDENDGILAVLPKHCRHSNDSTNAVDARLLLNVMMKLERDAIAGMGEDRLESDYPFESFYNIYEYYRKYGLYRDTSSRCLPQPPGKINWKATFSRSPYLMSGRQVFPFPFWYSHPAKEESFLTACMAHAIDSTIERFSILLDGFQPTGMKGADDYLSGDSDWIVRTLGKIEERTFRDSTVNLVRSLRDFYSNRNRGGGIALRYASFDRCWEILVDSYLKRHFAGLDENGVMEFTDNGHAGFGAQVVFNRFNNAIGKSSQELRIDHYLYDPQHDIQYIVDEKYYRDVHEFNYKQFAYTIMLYNHPIPKTGRPASLTYSTLVIPSERFRHDVHYVPNKTFLPSLAKGNADRKGLNIYEEYLDMRTVMEDYIR